MKKQLIALVLTLVLALALSAPAQADMDAATALIESYVKYYNVFAVFAGGEDYSIPSIETWTKTVADSGEWIGYAGNLDLDPPQTFLFYIDEATSGINKILLTISTEAFKDNYQNMLASMVSFALMADVDTTGDFSENIGEKAAEALFACMGFGDGSLLTDPVTSGPLSASFMVYDGTVYVDMKFNPPLTVAPEL